MIFNITWQKVMLVACGGGIGSVVRFLISTAVTNHFQSSRFPLGTFIVNIVGCLIIGILWSIGERWSFLSPSLRLLLFTGLLGGFTTFSAFGLETILLLRCGEIGIALLYIVLSLVCSLSILGLVIWAMRAMQ